MTSFKALITGFTCWICGCSFCIAQKADSLEAVLLRTKADSSKSILYSKIADELAASAPERATQSARTGLALASQISFDAGTFENYSSLALILQGQAQFDSSIYYLRKAGAIAKKRANIEDQAEVCSALGHSFMRKSEMDSARHYLEIGLGLARQINNHKIEAGIYNNYGNVFLGEQNDQEAIAYFVKAARLYENPLADSYGQSMALANIGNIAYRLGNYEQALDYAKQSMRIAELGSYPRIRAYVHRLTGRIYRQQEKYDLALKEYGRAEELHLAAGDPRSASEVVQNIGNIYFDQGKYQSALRNYEQSLTLARSISSQSLIAFAYSSIGMTYEALKQYDKALVYLDSSSVEALSIGDTYLLMDNYNAMSNTLEDKGDYKNALSMHRRYVELKDSIAQSENRQITEEIQARYELEKKEARISLLEKDQELQALALGRERVIQAGAVIAAGLAIIIALLLINRYRISSRAKRQTEIEQMRNTIARDLHDDIGSALSTINIMSKLAINENPGAHNIHLHRIADQSSRMMESMTDIVWSINPLNDSLERVAAKMRMFANEILEPLNITYRFADESLNGVSLDAEKKKNLFLIFKEAINNAAKYSQATVVNISLKVMEGRLILIVSDNGRGFERQAITGGNGLGNMEARARTIQGQVRVTSVAGEGTTVELYLPIT